jgi:hypothetical protein
LPHRRPKPGTRDIARESRTSIKPRSPGSKNNGSVPIPSSGI